MEGRRSRWVAAAVLTALTAVFGVLFANAAPCAATDCAAPNQMRAVWGGLTLCAGVAAALALPLRRQ